MARAIKSEQVTPADELRTLLDINEKRVVSLLGDDNASVDLLLDLDRIAELWPELEAQGVDLRPEAGRWETLQAAVGRNAREIVRQVQAAGGFPAVRARYQRTDAPAWWWTLDQQVRSQDRKRMTRTVRIAAIVLAAGVGIFFLLRLLFPVDPHVQAALSAMSDGERKILQEQDFAGAAADFRRAVEATPEDPDPWLRLGAALQKAGDATGAEAAFQRAQALLGSEVDLRVMRASVFVTFNMLTEAEADLQIAERLAPDEPIVYFYQANIFESRRQYTETIAALERADALANEKGLTQLVAVIRYRMGVVMQQAQSQMGIPTATP